MAITSQTSAQTTNATTLVCNLPASVAAGDMIVVIAGFDVGAGASTDNQSFTELKDETGTDVWAWIGYKKAAGGETSVTLTHTTERGNAIAYRIPAAEWHGTTNPEITAVGDGTSVNPDPPSITPSWGSETGTTFIACAILDDSAGVSTASAWPTNYTLNQVTSNTASSAASIHAAIRIAASSPENPSALTVSPSEHWRTYTLAIRGAVGGSSVSRTTTDSVTYADAITRVATLLRTATDSATYSGVVTRAVTLARTTADTVGLADAATQIKTILRSVADVVGISDAATRTLTLARTVADSITRSDAATRALALARTTADAVTQSDAATQVKVVLRTATDSATYSDAATRVTALVRAAADSFSIADVASAIKSGATVVGDAVLAFLDRMVAALSFSARQTASLSAIARQVATLTTSALEYDLSDTTRPTATFTVDDVATDPTTITLTVREPDGTSNDYTYGAAQITKSGTGVFYKDISLTKRGVWYFRFVGTGACAAAVEGTVTVRP